MKGAILALIISLIAAGYWLLSRQPDPVPESYLSAELWQSFQSRFIESGRIRDLDNGGISHSEGQGYGMLFAEAAGDREAFDAIWKWTQNTLQQSQGLFAWRYEPCAAANRSCVTDTNNASDAELLITWALLRAYKRWDEETYLSEARKIATITARELVVVHQEQLILMSGKEGFSGDQGVTLNPSYWVYPALESMAQTFPDQPWQQLAEQGRKQLLEMSAGSFGLPPDWVDLNEQGFFPSQLFPARYGFDAVRVPLHLAWTTKGITPAEYAPFKAFWTAYNPPPAWISLKDNQTADYSWSGGMQALAHFVKARADGHKLTEEQLLPPDEQEGYYSWSLYLLTQLALADTQGGRAE
ncbi:glycosyl hydrolase family 8 [Marinospirillum sp.]|uniref:glycosyl hydrolase family 8 n=1 Tax=Marinospirillum sp. TaxID=2183934 RepID=UPI00286FE4E5|nr:glycosyl hydrolase family 8 [Marinospirillum sp.]MDR9468991.1 glycosyl hydrolase family 8 [Marinospirillum sp.]